MVKMIVKVDGMMCSMCEAHINEAIRSAFPVKKVTSSHKKNETVILAPQAIDRDELAEVIGKTGYKVLDMSIQEETKKRLFGF
ncbi:MAG: heavy-metal-associated domain-containing protein [Erysipelotrichaceae bacterium]|nr:heavy-metal-associated domain-containing protein [Erysipelotrichaceae bacterium]